MIREVLGNFPVTGPGEAVALGNRGGFSGAQLWRGRGWAGDFCLRAWPSGFSPDSLETIHHLMRRARAAGLHFVPEVFLTRHGATSVAYQDRLWDVTGWMPGCADFHQHPTAARLTNALTALAQLHEAWKEKKNPVGPCPAVQRRLERSAQWQELIQSGWQPGFEQVPDPLFRYWAEKAWRILRARAVNVERELAPWREFPWPLQPCLCDIWHDHVLFTAEEVTGLVDYGSTKVDHVAVDLARLLGSLVPDDSTLWAAGLEAYGRLRELSQPEKKLVAVLDETGTVLGAANWLLWIYHQGRRFEDLAAAGKRLAALVARMERW